MDSRTNPLARRAMSIVGLLAGLVAGGRVMAQDSAQFIYHVNHSVFGDIGTYTNTVEPTRDGATVKTQAHFEVKMLGVRMHREDAERTERWQGNRLVAFRGQNHYMVAQSGALSHDVIDFAVKISRRVEAPGRASDHGDALHNRVR